MRITFGGWCVVALLGGCGGDAGYGTAQSHLDALTGNCLVAEGTTCLDAVTGGAPVPALLSLDKGGCWASGVGTFGKGDTRDSFGGDAMTMKDASVRGAWQHTDHHDVGGTTINGQNLFNGDVWYLACARFSVLPGPEVPEAFPNYANFGGKGRFNGVDGYFFDVRAFDHGEGGIYTDRYMINIYDGDKNLVLHADGLGTTTDPSDKPCEVDPLVPAELAWVKDLGCLSGGNFQIHAPNNGHPF